MVDLGGLIESAPILGGLRKRTDTGRRVHRHEHGLHVEGKRGPVVLPYATAALFTSLPPIPLGHRNRIPDHSETWMWDCGDGARWRSGPVRRDTALGSLLVTASQASTAVRLPVIRQRIDAGEVVTFGRHGRVSAAGVDMGAAHRRAWPDVIGLSTAHGDLGLVLDAGTTVMLGDDLMETHDAAVLCALVAERTGRPQPVAGPGTRGALG